MEIDTDKWHKIGETSNATFYEIEPHVLGIVPKEGSADDEVTAQASIDTQLAYLRAKGQQAGVIVFMDPLVEQTAGARKVYRESPDPAFQVCFALVGGTFFGRAIGSVFLGLSKPKVPTAMFGSFAEALRWCRTQVIQ